MTPEQLAIQEAIFDLRFGSTGWDVEPYMSPAEQAINKPILPVTDKSTNRMGHPRNWPGPDTPLVRAKFKDAIGEWHTLTFADSDLAIAWLDRQNPKTGWVVL